MKSAKRVENSERRVPLQISFTGFVTSIGLTLFSFFVVKEFTDILSRVLTEHYFLISRVLKGQINFSL